MGDEREHFSERRAADESASIVLYRDGPYLLRGRFRIVGQDGAEIDPGRRTVALCRCGKSRMRPFCDGTHRIANFRAAGENEAPPPAREPLPERRDRSPSGGVVRSPVSPQAGPGAAAVSLIRMAHDTVGAALGRAASAETYLGLRVAEPMLRAAWTLIETRALQPPVQAPVEVTRGGRPTARRLVASAIVAIDEWRAELEDPVLETVSALLNDAMDELGAGETEEL